jgi:DNA-directed RNA polymerase specialized sigma54-like protein
MRIAVLLTLLLASLDKEELDEFIWLMRSIQNRDETVIQVLANLHRELNEIE